MTYLAFALGLAVGIGAGMLIFKRFFTKSDAGEVLNQHMRDAFAAIASETLQRNSEQVVQLAETKLSGKKDVIDGTLKHMKDELKRVEELMQELSKGNVKVETRLSNAAEVIKELSESTGSLKNALASNSARGQWGERMAEDVLRLSGLIEGINYIKQKKLDGAGSKPDFTFLLPQQLKLNMDVKFPFNNYELYVGAKNETEKQQFKEKFLRDVRKRVKEIQTRDYINPEDKTVDYVLLFVPNEQIFGFINEIDRTLIDEAMQGRTILCSPLSLYAILAVIRQSMDNFSMESKSQEMLSLFGSFKQQWDKFKEHMGKVHTQFETVHKNYEELVGARERQLDKQLLKIDEIRADRGIEPAVEIAFKKAAEKQLTATATEVL